jgi:hypothetical protein
MEGMGVKSERTRVGISVALTVIAALLLLVGGLALYLREDIVDSEAFADRATQSLEQDAVRTAVARELAAAFTDVGPPQLVSGRPILESVIEAIIGTEPFERLFREAASQANKVLFSRERTVVVQLEDATKVVRSALESANPKLAKKLPDNVSAELATLDEAKLTTGTLRAADDVRLLGIVLPPLALVAFAGAIAVAPDRRASVTRSGIAVGIVGAAALIALTVLRTLVVDGLEPDVLDEEELRAAGEAVWDGFLGDLSGWSLAVGAAGLVLAAASSSLFEVKDVGEQAQRLRDWLTRTPQTTAGRLGRGVTAIVLGVVVVVHPTLALQIVAVVAGALLLFFGTGEVLNVVQLPEARSAAYRRATRRRWLTVAGGAAATVIVVAAVLVAVIDGGGEDARGPIDPDEIGSCNGSPKLCDRRLNEVTFPGTHNSMSAADTRGWLFTNQRHDIAHQLDDGIRVLLIDPHYGVPSGDKVRTDLVREGTSRNRVGKSIGAEGLAAAERLAGDVGGTNLEGERVPYLCHSVCELGATPMEDGLGDVRAFLEENRFEVVVIFIEPSIDADDIEAAFRDAGLLPYLATLQRYEPLPTLRELIASNRRLVVFTERGGGTPDWYHEGFSFTQDTVVGAELDKCEGRNGNAASPLMMLNHWVDGFPPPVEANEDVTKLDDLLKRARVCRRELGRVPNLFPVDFYGSSDIVEAAERLNGLGGKGERSGEG